MTGDAGGAVRATTLSGRSTAPDLARALMLALIALANVHLFLFGSPVGVRGYPVPVDGTDTVVAGLGLLLVDGRVYPLFGLLLGYGLARAGERAGDRAPSVLARRGVALILVGLAHGVLLFSGDIVGAYGVLTLALSGLVVTAASPALLVAVVATVLLGLLMGAPSSSAGVAYQPSVAMPDALAALAQRASEWPATTFASAIIVLPAVLAGVLLARGGYLDRPTEHRRLFVGWALIGLPVGAALGTPFTLIAVGWWTPAVPPDPLVGMAHTAGGYLGALGWLGVLGLLAGVRRLPGRDLLAAAGTWSLTLYVTQSAVFSFLLAAWAGGLGDGMSIGTGALVALATWAVSVLVAGMLARRGVRGPLERVVRFVAYGT